MATISSNKTVIHAEDPALVKAVKTAQPRFAVPSTVITGTPPTRHTFTASDTTTTTTVSRADDINSSMMFNTDKTLYVTTSYDVSMYDKLHPINAATAVVTHDVSLSHVFYHTNIISNFTANIINIGLQNLYSTNVIMILNQSATAYLPDAIQIDGVSKTIKWQAGEVPTGNANKTDLVCFTVTYVNDTYNVMGQLVSFG